MDLIDRLRTFVACDGGDLADVEMAADEIERLTKENANLKTVMVAAAEEIQAHWSAHCDAEGYGPANLMRRLEEGIPSEYGYTAGAFERLTKERDALKQELDLRRKSGSASDRLHNICEGLREDADSSPFSREEWDRLDAENVALRKERDALRRDAERAVGKTAARCVEMAMWPQGLDDEQAYYGKMFAEFITKEFGAAIDAARKEKI